MATVDNSTLRIDTVAFGTPLPFTAVGDMVYRAAGSINQRLPVGTAGQVLKVVGGIPTWATDVGFSDPLTAVGDLVYRDALNVSARLPVGTAGQVLTTIAGVPVWADAAAGELDSFTPTGGTKSIVGDLDTSGVGRFSTIRGRVLDGDLQILGNGAGGVDIYAGDGGTGAAIELVRGTNGSLQIYNQLVTAFDLQDNGTLSVGGQGGSFYMDGTNMSITTSGELFFQPNSSATIMLPNTTGVFRIVDAGTFPFENVAWFEMLPTVGTATLHVKNIIAHDAYFANADLDLSAAGVGASTLRSGTGATQIVASESLGYVKATNFEIRDSSNVAQFLSDSGDGEFLIPTWGLGARLFSSAPGFALSVTQYDSGYGLRVEETGPTSITSAPANQIQLAPGDGVSLREPGGPEWLRISGTEAGDKVIEAFGPSGGLKIYTIGQNAGIEMSGAVASAALNLYTTKTGAQLLDGDGVTTPTTVLSSATDGSAGVSFNLQAATFDDAQTLANLAVTDSAGTLRASLTMNAADGVVSLSSVGSGLFSIYPDSGGNVGMEMDPAGSTTIWGGVGSVSNLNLGINTASLYLNDSANASAVVLIANQDTASTQGVVLNALSGGVNVFSGNGASDKIAGFTLPGGNAELRLGNATGQAAFVGAGFGATSFAYDNTYLAGIDFNGNTSEFHYLDVGGAYQWQLGGAQVALLNDAGLKLDVVGMGYFVKEGTNATMGVATLVAGSVVVPTTKVTATSRIFVTVQVLGGIAVPVGVAVTARTAATSFTITSASVLDTSTVAWQIVEPS